MPTILRRGHRCVIEPLNAQEFEDRESAGHAYDTRVDVDDEAEDIVGLENAHQTRFFRDPHLMLDLLDDHTLVLQPLI